LVEAFSAVALFSHPATQPRTPVTQPLCNFLCENLPTLHIHIQCFLQASNLLAQYSTSGGL